MLYQLYEMQRAASAPVRFMATNALSMLEAPCNPLGPTPAGRIAAAALDSLEHGLRPFGKPQFGLPETVIDGQVVAVREEVVAVRPWCALKRFRRAVDRPGDPRVLLVAPMSGHYATLLRGTVEAMLPDCDVFVTDWADAKQVPLMAPEFSLDDYIDYVADFIRLIGPGTHVVAVCQPSVPVMAAVSLMAAADDPLQPASMTLIGGPIDTREAPTEVNLFAKRHGIDWFERRVIDRVPFGYPGFMRQVYPGFVQLAGFMAMNLDRHMKTHWEMFLHLVDGDREPLAAKRRFYEEYRSVMDLSAEFYLQTIRVVFHDHLLPRGLWESRGRKVEPAAIRRTALLTIEGERDDISGLGQTRAAHALCSSLPEGMRQHREQPGVGHYGLFNGRSFRRDIAPRIREFMLANANASAGANANASAGANADAFAGAHA